MDNVSEIVTKYFAMGNIYINKSVDWIPPKVSVVLSVITLIGCVVFITLIDCPTEIMQTAQRALLGLSIAGLTTPWIQFFRLGKQHLRGVAFIGLFLVVYLLSPRVEAFNRCDDLMVSGRVLIGNQPLVNAHIKLPDHAKSDITNSSGEFSMGLDYRMLNQAESCQLVIQSGMIDTTLFYASPSIQQTLLIHLPDTVSPLSEANAKNLLKEHMEQRQKKVEAAIAARVVELEGRTTTLDEIVRLYKGFESIDTYYRNEFKFIGADKVIKYRKNLIDAGIHEVDPLTPYVAHHLPEHQALLIEYLDSSDAYFGLEYAFNNAAPVRLINHSIERTGRLKAKIRASYAENIRAVKVRLEISNTTNYYKQRTMEFYGFLPEEEYNVHFRNGEWRINHQL